DGHLTDQLDPAAQVEDVVGPQVTPVEQDRTAVGVVEPVEEPQQRGLSRPRRTDHDREPSGGRAGRETGHDGPIVAIDTDVPVLDQVAHWMPLAWRAVIDPDLRKAEDEGWHELHSLIDSLPAGAVERPGYFEEGWSAKDLLAHIGAWLAQAGVALEQIGGGTYRADEIDVDALNGRYLETLRALPFDVVRAQADAARARMLIASAAVASRNGDPALWIRKAGPDHYAEHLPRLREWVKEAASHGTPVGPAAVPAGVDLGAVEARRAELVARYLKPAGERPPSSARGVHHIALLSSDVEQTIRFYQELLEFPLTEIFENRDYKGSNHFFFDIGHGNLLAFFDFPG